MTARNGRHHPAHREGKMVRLGIDGRMVDVPEGTNVLEAAERIGIAIPKFCYHPALGSVGACRVCAVMFEDGPVKGLHMSCMQEAREGMVVSTIHPEAVRFRRYVIEWLMLNHPHDCPVCDEGGHCLLQDLTVAGGHSIRRYTGLKRTYHNQDLGPLVQQAMNRCIHCYRCVRMYQEFAGYRDFGALNLADRVFFGRYADGTLESPFSGNLVDVCPTGVFTDKPARYKARRWDVERGDSVCIHCSTGCNITVEARHRSVVRIQARVNEAVNGHFMCDRGRFGYSYEGLPERPRQARVDGNDVAVDEALAQAAQRLAAIRDDDGPSGVACLGGSRSTLEAIAGLKRLATLAEWTGPEFFLDSATKGATLAAVDAMAPDISVSLQDVAGADLVVMAGADPVNEAPMLALAIRQAVRKGARVVAIDPRPVKLPCEYMQMGVARGDVGSCLGALVKQSVAADGLAAEWAGPFHASLPDSIPEHASLVDPGIAVELLAGSARPVIVCGTATVMPGLPGQAADCARLLAVAGKRPGFFPILSGGNGFGAALYDARSTSGLEELVEAMDQGRIRALVVVEADPLSRVCDPGRLSAALDRLDLLLVLDCLPSVTARRAHVFLPTRTVFEQDGCWINQGGRLQVARKVFQAGTPIGQTNDGDHPPREFIDRVPGSQPREAWRMLAGLARELGLDPATDMEDPWGVAVDGLPLLGQVPFSGMPEEGVVLSMEGRPEEGSRAGRQWTDLPMATGTEPGKVRVFLTDHVLGGDELAGYSLPLLAAMDSPEVYMEKGLAEEGELADGMDLILPFQTGPVKGRLRTSRTMAPGILVMPRRADNHWQRCGGETELDLERIWPEHSEPGHPGPGREEEGPAELDPYELKEGPP